MEFSGLKSPEDLFSGAKSIRKPFAKVYLRACSLSFRESGVNVRFKLFGGAWAGVPGLEII